MKTEFTEEDALNAARVFYPNAKNVVKIDKGYMHFLFEVDSGTGQGDVVVRFSNGNKGHNSLGKEIRVNKILENKSLPVPRVIYHHKPNKNFAEEFAILSKLPGEDISDLWEKISEEEKYELSRKMGELLGKLHSIKLDTFGLLNEEGIENKYLKFSMKKQGRHEEPINLHTADYFARSFNDIGLVAAFDFTDVLFVKKILNYLLERKSFVSTDEEPTLIHGDYEIRNLRAEKINGKWEIVGLVDFEYSGALMREFDFIKLQRVGFLDAGKVRDSFLEGYSKHQVVSDDFDDKITLFRTIRDVGFAVYLLKAGNKELAEKVLKQVEERINEN